MPRKPPKERTRDPPAPRLPRKKPGERAPLNPTALRQHIPPLEIRCPKCRRKIKLRGIGVELCYSGECGHCRIEIEAVAAEQAGGEPTLETYPMPGGKKKKGESSAANDEEFPPDDYHLYFPFDGPHSEGREPRKKGGSNHDSKKAK